MKRALLTLLCTLSALAQWPTNPAQNLLICNHAGEEAVPKIAAMSDGGCYVLWWDHTSGNYDVYLQRLDSDGIPQWNNPCGILISDHPQETWLTDWDMAVDASDNCIIAVNDIRNGADRDITVYSIGPQQEFLWGADGIALSNNEGFEPDPRILPMGNGDVVFAWQEETSIHVRKLDRNGIDVFNPPTITFTQADGVSIPRLAALDNSGFALSYLAQQGTQFTSPRHLYVRSYNDDGSNRWMANGIPIMTTNGIGIQMKPDIIGDTAGGAYVYWYDARGNVHHCYVQHIGSDGVAHWTANGLQVDLSGSELQMSPSAILVPEGVAVVYQTANTNQSQGGVDAQLLDSDGNYLWSPNGVTIAPLSTSPCFNVRAFRQTTNYGVFYSQYAPGSAINTLLHASQLNPAGSPTWTPPIKDLCTVASEKGRPYTCVNPQSQIIACWPDARNGNMDMYVQNINADGSLGPNSVFPPEIGITSPEDSATVRTADIDIIFEVHNFFIDPDNGDGYVSVMVNDQDPDVTNEVAPYPVHLNLGWNMITMEILDLEFLPLDPPAIDSVHVFYQLPPAIYFTSPTQDTVSLEDHLTIQFAVENFVLAEQGGDGYGVLLVDPPQMGMPQSYDLFDTSPVEVHFNEIGNYECTILLMDSEGEFLDPLVGDTVIVNYPSYAADNPIVQPSSFILHEAYPNPFNATVTLSYDVPTPAHIALDIIDITGRQIASLINENSTAGTHSTQWQADHFPSGLYFVRLTSGNFIQTQKIILLK
jgi:hypothetical protein